MDDVNRVMADRLRKLDELREAGVNPFANGFTPTATCAELLASGAGGPDMDAIAEDAPRHRVAGRLMAKNKMGKAMFMRVRDRSVGVSPEGPLVLQVHVRRDVVGAELFSLLKSLDMGDFLAFEGPMFVTRRGEPTLSVEKAQLLTKSIRPLPEKFHGLSDQETRYRQRYVDLAVNPDTKAVFRERSVVIQHIRETLSAHDYIEVETPMMHPIPGGATARPFVTHHNALDMPLYMRIAPELYLKRLLVGGLERVFEINRNFRNEGLSVRHNPEFTMVEFYQAYATYEDLIALTEAMLSSLAAKLNDDGTTTRPFGEHVIDWGAPWARYTVQESLTAVGGLDEATVADPAALLAAIRATGEALEGGEALPYGKLLMEAFEAFVEGRLIQPTFITHFPVEVSPLARRNEADPMFTDRFEFFAAGMELGNAFSELNDPIDQRQRFEAQVAQLEAGDDEAMFMDLDYIRALEYGMPPAAGEGIGVDRVVMLMTNRASIREVVLFPHMRPE